MTSAPLGLGDESEGDELSKYEHRKFTGNSKIQLMQLSTMLDVAEKDLLTWKAVFDNAVFRESGLCRRAAKYDCQSAHPSRDSC